VTLVRREAAQKLAAAGAIGTGLPRDGQSHEPPIFWSESQGSGKGGQLAARTLKSSLSLKDLQHGNPSSARPRYPAWWKSPGIWKKVSTGGVLRAPEWI